MPGAREDVEGVVEGGEEGLVGRVRFWWRWGLGLGCTLRIVAASIMARRKRALV